MPADPTTISEHHTGKVTGVSDIVDVTLSLDTSAYADGDTLAATQEVANAMRVNGGAAILLSLKAQDDDDNGTALDLVFLRSNVALGTENAAPSITDANAVEVLGIVSIAAADWIDLGGVRVATKTNIGLLLETADASKSLYIAAITRGGTPTYTASGIKLQLGLLKD